MEEDANTPIELFLKRYPEDVVELAVKALGLIREIMPDGLEQLDVTANLIGYGLDRGYKGLVCGIIFYKTYVNLMFAQGALLSDPGGLLSGTGKKARHIKIKKLADLEKPGVRTLLFIALEMKRNEMMGKSI